MEEILYTEPVRVGQNAATDATHIRKAWVCLLKLVTESVKMNQ